MPPKSEQPDLFGFPVHLDSTVPPDAVFIRRQFVPPPECHHVEDRTETDWGEPYGVRMTWTCRHCGGIRGRC